MRLIARRPGRRQPGAQRMRNELGVGLQAPTDSGARVGIAVGAKHSDSLYVDMYKYPPMILYIGSCLSSLISWSGCMRLLAPEQAPAGALSCSIQKRNAVCVQKRNSTAGQVLGIQAAAKFGFAGFFALELAPAGACRAAEAARPAVCQAPDGAWVASPQSPILRRSDSIFVPSPGTDNKKQPTGLIIPLLTAQTCPLLIAPPQPRLAHFKGGVWQRARQEDSAARLPPPRPTESATATPGARRLSPAGSLLSASHTSRRTKVKRVGKPAASG